MNDKIVQYYYLYSFLIFNFILNIMGSNLLGDIQMGDFMKQTDKGNLDLVYKSMYTKRKMECPIYCQKYEKCLTFSVDKLYKSGEFMYNWVCMFSEIDTWNSHVNGSKIYQHVNREPNTMTTQPDTTSPTQVTTQAPLPPCTCQNGGHTCHYVGSTPTCTCLHMFNGAQCQHHVGCGSPPTPSNGPSGGNRKIILNNPSPVKIELVILTTNNGIESLQVLSEYGGPWEKSDIPVGSRLYVRDDSNYNRILPMKSTTNEWFCWKDMPSSTLSVSVYENYTP